MMDKAIPTVILAGGRGARMGGNKPLHPHGETTLIEATLAGLRSQSSSVFINAGTAGSPMAIALVSLGHPLIFDDAAFAGLGPLSGVLSALRLARDGGHAAVITAPCDMPNLPVDMVTQLLVAGGAQADVFHFSGERDYPLCALWTISVLADLEAALSSARAGGGLSVMRFLSTQWVRRIKVFNDHAFANVNTPLMSRQMS